MVLEAQSAIFLRESRKELKDDMVKSSWDCREKLLVSKESTRGKEVCNNKIHFLNNYFEFLYFSQKLTF